MKKKKDISPMTLGERLEKLRMARNMSMSELGKKVDSSHVQIGKYEKGDQIPSANMLLSIANELGTSVDYLLKGSEHQNELFEKIKRLSDEEQRKVSNLVNDLLQLHDLKIVTHQGLSSLIRDNS